MFLRHLIGLQVRILTGAARQDGTVAKLSFESQVILVKAHGLIASAQAELLYEWLSPRHFPSSTCTNNTRCAGKRENLTRQIFVPAYNLREMEKWPGAWDRNFCSECLKASKKSWVQGCQKFWEMLPTYFDLPGWAELKNDI